MKKRIIPTILAVVMMFGCMSLSVSADKYKTVGGIRYVYTDAGKQKGKYTGWDGSGKTKYYYKDGVMLKDTWLSVGGKPTYFFDKNGKMVTGEYVKDGKYCLFGDDGKVVYGFTADGSDASRTGMTLTISGIAFADKNVQVRTTSEYTIEYKTSKGVWKPQTVIAKDKTKSKSYKIVAKGKLKTVTLDIDWIKTYGGLAAGEYRLSKTYYVKQSAKAKEEKKTLTVEFSFRNVSDAEKKWGVILGTSNVTTSGLTLKIYQSDSAKGYITWNGIYTLEYQDKSGNWREVDISARLMAEKRGKFNKVEGLFGEEGNAKGKAGGAATEKISFYTDGLKPGKYRIKRIFFGECNGKKGQFYGNAEFEVR